MNESKTKFAFFILLITAVLLLTMKVKFINDDVINPKVERRLPWKR